MTASVRVTTPSRIAWFGVVTPPLAWAIQLVVDYSLEDAACGRPGTSLWGASVHFLMTIVVIAAFALALAGGLTSALMFMRGGVDERGISQFFAVVGVLGSAVFLLAIVLTGIALIPIDACSAR